MQDQDPSESEMDTPEGEALEEGALEETSPEEDALEEAPPEEAALEEAPPEEAASDEAALDEGGLDQDIPEEGAHREESESITDAIPELEAPPQNLPKEGELLSLHFDPLEMAPFLADEFILWLWFASERNYTSFPLGDGESVDLWIDDRLTFSAVEEKQISSTFKGGAPSTLPEAKLSILSGKRVGEAKIGLRRKEAEWSFALKVRAGQLLITGLKIPGTVKDGWEEMIYERMYLIDSVTEVMETLFAQFFRIRTSSEWHDKEAPEIRLWLMGDED